MTATVTVTNPEGNQATVYVVEDWGDPENIDSEFSVAMGESRTFSVYGNKKIHIQEIPWDIHYFPDKDV